MKEGYFRIKRDNLEENFYIDKNAFVVLTPNAVCAHQMNTIDYKEKKEGVIRLFGENNPDFKYLGNKGMTIRGKYKNIATGKDGVFTSKIKHKIEDDLIIFNFEINYDKGSKIVKKINKVSTKTF